MNFKNLIFVFVSFAAYGLCSPSHKYPGSQENTGTSNSRRELLGDHETTAGDSFKTYEIVPKQLSADTKEYNSALDSLFADCKQKKDQKACIELTKMIIRDRAKKN